MKILRSAFALLLSFALLLTAVGCGYSPVKSSEEELTTALTLDGTLSVPYEMYRFYFLSELSLAEIDPATLGEEEKKTVFAEIHQKTVEELAAVYAVLSLAEKNGIDIESRDFDKYVKENVAAMVDACGGKDAYLAELASVYMNDSVFRLLHRYFYAEELLSSALRESGVLKSDKESVLSYMNSDECVRVSWIRIPYTALSGFTDARLNVMEADAKAATDSAFLEMTHAFFPPEEYTDADLDRGFYIGKYELDLYYEELIETAFSLDVGETSSFIDSGDGKYIVRRFEKDPAYISDEKNLSEFTEYYLLNSFYGLIAEEAARLVTTAETTEFFASLTLDSLKMMK